MNYGGEQLLLSISTNGRNRHDNDTTVCESATQPQHGLMLTILHSVGAAPAINDPQDVSVVQEALNTVPPECGGPSNSLDTSGNIDTDTVDAITSFQQARYVNSDGRVDPGGRTLSDLSIYSDAASNTDPNAAPPEVFCDVAISGGPCGPNMMQRLRRVEVSLRQQSPRDQDFRAWCGVSSVDGHQGRSTPVPIGKAVDLNANTNPYIITRTFIGGNPTFGGEQGGTPLSQGRRASVAGAYDRAMAWRSGIADVSGRHTDETTADAWLRFRAVSSSLSNYLSFAILPNGPSRIARSIIPNAENSDYDTLLSSIPADGPFAERWDADTALQQITDFLNQFTVPVSPPIPGADLFQAWHAQILRDYEMVRLPLLFGDPTPTPKTTRNPVYGFMDLRSELVVAMCDSAIGGLAWGACDLGPNASGDMMHFQTP